MFNKLKKYKNVKQKPLFLNYHFNVLYKYSEAHTSKSSNLDSYTCRGNRSVSHLIQNFSSFLVLCSPTKYDWNGRRYKTKKTRESK